jgi:uncharacterized cupredoxin-like copper-binding protein
MRAIALLPVLGLLAACASTHAIEPRLAPASVNFGSAKSERVELANFDFTPREIHLRAGEPYELVLENVTSGGHDFAAPEFFAAAQIKPSDAPLVAQGKVDIPAASTRRVHLVPAHGTYKLVCTHTGHSLLGMTGTIVVD